MKSYISPKIKKKKNNIGYGLFTSEEICKGELVIDFSNSPGKLINTKEADALFKKGFDYILQIDENSFLAATNEQELEDSDFLNHSCNPNCGIKDKVKIVAMRNIEPGEEITFDYAMSESSKYKMKCSCQSPNCRKIITGEDWKIKELQKKYKGFFSEYIQRKIDKIRK